MGQRLDWERARERDATCREPKFRAGSAWRYDPATANQIAFLKRLSSLFMFDRLVFVEGPTDEAIVREWAVTLGLNLGSANVGFIPMGGARNFAFFAAERTLSFLSHRRVAMWFVLDRDERDDADVAAMTEQAGDRAVVAVLNRRELENYLLVPRAIAEFVAQKQELGGVSAPAPTTEELHPILLEEADRLKSVALDRRLEKALGRPVYLRRKTSGEDAAERMKVQLEEMQSILTDRIEGLAATAEEIKQELDASWEAEKLNLVPGDELLDAVCKRYQVRYRKDRGDGAKLAALMRPGEISRDIEDLLDSIAR